MPGAAIGALLGWAFTGFASLGATITFLGMSMTAFGAIMIGASLGSLFDAPSLDMSLGGATPNYSFGPLSNTKTQLIPVPVVYGRCRMGGNVFLQRFHDDKKETMDMMVGLSEGPISRIVSVMVNEHVLYGEGAKPMTYWVLDAVAGADPVWRQVSRTEYEDFEGKKEIRGEDGTPGYTVTDLGLAGCSCDVHLGESSQAPDTRSLGDLPYNGLAYVAVTLKAQEGLSGTPTIVSIVEGRKVWTPAGTRYTRNPAWIVWDLLTDARYGVGIPAVHLDLETFEAAAAVCDHLVNGEPRYTLDYIIDAQRPAIDVLRDMLACFRGYFICRERIELHIDREVLAPYKAIGPDQIVMGSLQIWQAAADDVPNRLLVEWVDPNNYYERSTAVFENQADMARRGVVEKQVSMLGITSAAQVERMGGYLLAAAQETREFCSFGLALQDADVEVGDVVALTSEWGGYSGKWFRVLSLEDSGDDSIRVTCAEYSSSAYEAAPIPFIRPTPDTPPVNYDDIHDLVLSLEGRVEADGTWFPAIGARWGRPTSWTPEHIEVQYRHKDDPGGRWALYAAMPGDSMEALIESGLRTGQLVTVWVRAKGKDGRISTGKMESVLLEKDTTPPGAPSSLTATGWFGAVWLEWVNPSDADFKFVEVWECSTDNRASAVKIAEVPGTSYDRYLGSFQTRYYWVRAVDMSGNVSQWNTEAGTMGYSDQESHDDFVELLIRQNPVILEIIEDLNTEIERIDSIVDDVGDIVIDVNEIKTVTIPAAEDQIVQLRDITVPAIDYQLGQLRDITVPAISAEIDEVRESDIPAIVDGLKTEVQDSVDAAQNAADAVIRALIDLGDVGQILRDAGIQVDPEDGKVKIWATEALREEHQAVLTSLSIELDAQAGQIQQRATHAEVDEAIAQAVFGDAGELLLSGVDARINEVSSTLDALDASIEDRALQVVTDATGGTLTDVQQRLSAAEGNIETRATKVELETTADGVDVRLSMAESRIDAAEGSIGDLVVGMSQEGVDPADITAEGLVNAILNGADMLEDWQGELAIAKRELVAHTEEGLSAEAAERVKLAAVVDSNYAEAQHELSVLATQQTVEATRTNSLLVRMGDAESAILEEQEARVDADSAEAAARQALAVTVGENTAAIQAEQSARISGDSAEAQARQALAVRVGNNETGLIQEAEARADLEEALTETTTLLQAGIGAVEDQLPPIRSAIQTEAQARADADTAEALLREALESVVDDNTAAIQEEAQTRATADSAMASQTRTMVASLSGEAGDAQVEAILGQAHAGELTLAQVAALREDVVVEIEEGRRSSAAITQEIYARLNEAEAGIIHEYEVVTDLESALAREKELLQAKFADAMATIDREAEARATADSAEAHERELLDAAINDPDTGVRAAIETEAQARADADSAEASSRESLRTELQGEIDSDVSAAIDGIREVISDEVSALARQTTALVAQLGGTAGDALVDDVLGRAEGTDIALRQYAAIQETMDVAVTETNEAIARVETTLSAAIGENYAAIRNEAETRASETETLARVTQSLTAVTGQNTAAIQDESLVRSTADEALAQKTTTLAAITLGDGEGSDIEEVSTLPVDSPVGAIPEGKVVYSTILKKYYIWELYSPGPGGYWREVEGVAGHSFSKSIAAVKTEEEARTTAISAEALQRQTLEAVVIGAGTNVTEVSTLPASGTTGQIVFHTGVKKYYIWKWSDVYGRELWVEINGVAGHSGSSNRAAIQQEITARTTADSAIAGSVQTLQTTVNGHTSSISTINQSVNGIKSKHGVKIDTNGYVTGYELIGTGSSGSMVFLVDNFMVGRPNHSNQYPFVMGYVTDPSTGARSYRISMSNAFIQDAAISSAKIADLTVGTMHIKNYAVTNTHYADHTPAPEETPPDDAWSVNLVIRGVKVDPSDTVMVHAGGVFQFNSGDYDYHGGFLLRLFGGPVGTSPIAELDYYKYVQKVGGTGGMPFLIAGMAPSVDGINSLRLNAYCWGYNQSPARVNRGHFEKCWMIIHQVRK